ncbi:MAG: GNAT family N-acetyltransferase [Micavibrio sp.]
MSPVIEYRRVRRDDSLSMGYLKLIYNTTYPELFPHVDDRESWEQWMHYLNTAADENFFILAGENMHQQENATIHGFVIGSYFKQSQTGLISYIGVDKKHRSDGVATGLIDSLTAVMESHAQSHGRKLNGLFAEANDPAQVTPSEDSLPPAVRLKIYHRWKALQVPVTYSYPIIRSPWKKDGCMLLLSLPIRDQYATPQAVLGMIADYYRTSGIDPLQDSDFHRIRNEIAGWAGYISLAPYDQKALAEAA